MQTLEQVIEARWTLDDLELHYARGLVEADVVRAYLDKWNATRGRFTRAELRDGRIRQTLIDADA